MMGDYVSLLVVSRNIHVVYEHGSGLYSPRTLEDRKGGDRGVQQVSFLLS